MTAPAPVAPVVPEIRGRVRRTYRVRDVAEIDANLRDLSAWRSERITESPRFAEFYLAKYHADVDALLEVRHRISKRGSS